MNACAAPLDVIFFHSYCELALTPVMENSYQGTDFAKICLIFPIGSVDRKG